MVGIFEAKAIFGASAVGEISEITGKGNCNEMGGVDKGAVRQDHAQPTKEVEGLSGEEPRDKEDRP